MRQVRQTDPGQLQVLQIDKWNRVAIKKRHVLRVDIKQLVSGLLNVQRLQIGAGINQPWEDEVIRRDELQRVDVLPHVSDVGRLLRQRHVKLASDAISQGHLSSIGKDMPQIRHDFVNGDLHLVFVFHRHAFHMIEGHIFQPEHFT